jgi:hypothetical protein
MALAPKKIGDLTPADTVAPIDMLVVETADGTCRADVQQLHQMEAPALSTVDGTEEVLVTTPSGVRRMTVAQAAALEFATAGSAAPTDKVNVRTALGLRTAAVQALMMVAAAAASTLDGSESLLLQTADGLRSTTALGLLQQTLAAAGSAASATDAEYLVRVGGVAKTAKLADIHAANFAAKALLSGTDSIVARTSDGTPVRIPGTGFAASKLVQRVDLKVNGGKNVYKYTTSGSTTKAAIKALILADNPDLAGVSEDLIFIDVQAIQGGAGGAWGATNTFGGFGGDVAVRLDIPLSALPDTIPYVVGLGGAPGNGGGYSEFCNSGAPDAWVQSSTFSIRGGNNAAEQSSQTEAMRAMQGYVGADMGKLQSSWAAFVQANNYDGPGHGGACSTLFPIAGGGASYGRVKSKFVGPATASANGNNAFDDDFWSYGTGGAGGAASGGTGIGGNGGIPGGGGGAGVSGNATTNGGGGRGEVRWRAWVYKAVTI